MSVAGGLTLVKWVFLVVALVGMIGGCAAQTATAPPSTTPTKTTTSHADLPQLRIVNSGHEDIAALVVLFPGPTADAPSRRVKFGDVSAGQATAFHEVPSGVYRYAAYEYAVGSRLVGQKVTDWVGETPMAGGQFTYRVAFDVAERPGNQVRLIEVVVDEP